MIHHPCVTCGACCAQFRVLFHWSETLPESHGVPEGSFDQASPHLNAMKGTNQVSPRCEELTGIVGDSVGCSIYENRPSPCRNFQASLENGEVNSRCDDARQKKGLRILNLEDWSRYESKA